MRVIDVSQGSDEWLQARAGRLTSSGIADALAVPRRKSTQELECRLKYKKRLAMERKNGRSYDTGYVSRAMREGKEAEPIARAAYECKEGVFVDTVGLVLHPTIEFAAASPDGLVGDDGLIEIKAPEPTTHFDYLLLGNQIPEECQLQCLWMLACTRRQWIDFVSFDKTETFAEDERLHVVRMIADPGVICDIEEKAKQFLREVNGVLVQARAIEKVTA